MFDVLKGTINNSITANGSGDIVGAVLNTVLNNIVTVIGEGGAVFLGIASAGTLTTPIRPAFYFATAAGNYTYGGATILSIGANENKIGLLYYGGSSWVAYNLLDNAQKGVVRCDIAQSLSSSQKSQARTNISSEESGACIQKDLGAFKSGETLETIVIKTTDGDYRQITLSQFKEIINAVA